MALLALKLGCAWVALNPTTKRPELFVGVLQNSSALKGLFKYDPAGFLGDTNNAPIRSYYQPGPLAPDKITGIHLFTSLRFSGRGFGTLKLYGAPQTDGGPAIQFPPITLAESPNAYKTRMIQHLADKLTLVFGSIIDPNNLTDYRFKFNINALDVDTEEVFEGNLNE